MGAGHDGSAQTKRLHSRSASRAGWCKVDVEEEHWQCPNGDAMTARDAIRCIRFPGVYAALLTAWILDWRGFWHGAASMATVWLMWAIATEETL